MAEDTPINEYLQKIDQIKLVDLSATELLEDLKEILEDAGINTKNVEELQVKIKSSSKKKLNQKEIQSLEDILKNVEKRDNESKIVIDDDVAEIIEGIIICLSNVEKPVQDNPAADEIEDILNGMRDSAKVGETAVIKLEDILEHLQRYEKDYQRRKVKRKRNYTVTGIKKEFVKFDSKRKIKQIEINNEEDRWIDFRWMCRGGDARKESDVITGFDWTDEEVSKSIAGSQGYITLPDAMYKYDDLPEEEGIKPDEVIEIMKEYSDSLVELTEKETWLDTQIDCAVYAEQYLDILDQIAYLLNSRALATDSSTFFENNFSFGLTLKIWYDLKVFGSKGQEGRWDEFMKYCDNFTDDNYNPEILKAFNIKQVLPQSMLFFDNLPIDTIDKKSAEYPSDPDKEAEVWEFYNEWQRDYDNWVRRQRRNIYEQSKRESIQMIINEFRKKKQIRR